MPAMLLQTRMKIGKNELAGTSVNHKRGTIQDWPRGTTNTRDTAMQARTCGRRCTWSRISIILRKFVVFLEGSAVNAKYYVFKITFRFLIFPFCKYRGINWVDGSCFIVVVVWWKFIFLLINLFFKAKKSACFQRLHSLLYYYLYFKPLSRSLRGLYYWSAYSMHFDKEQVSISFNCQVRHNTLIYIG